MFLEKVIIMNHIQVSPMPSCMWMMVNKTEKYEDTSYNKIVYVGAWKFILNFLSNYQIRFIRDIIESENDLITNTYGPFGDELRILDVTAPLQPEGTVRAD